MPENVTRASEKMTHPVTEYTALRDRHTPDLQSEFAKISHLPS
jgi:hypothetical protein